MMNLFEELGIEDRLQWKPHRMTFAMQDLPGEFTSFEFPAGVPAPFNMATAILLNTEMLTLEEKIRMVPGLLPMLLEGQVSRLSLSAVCGFCSIVQLLLPSQDFIDRQDELSVLEFMQAYGMPERINDEIFIAMGKVQLHALPLRIISVFALLCGLRGAGARLHRPRQAVYDSGTHRYESFY